MGTTCIRTAVAVMLGLALPACAGYRVDIVDAAQVSPYEETGELGTVCVLRPQSFAALAQAVHRDNGRVVGVTHGGRVYFCYRAYPGLHRLTATTDNTAELDVTVQSGRPLFVRLQLNMGPDEIFQVHESEARQLLPDLDYVVARPSSEHVDPITADPIPSAAPRGG